MSISRQEDLVAGKYERVRRVNGGLRESDIEQLKQMQQDVVKASEAGFKVVEDRRDSGDRRIEIIPFVINDRKEDRRSGMSVAQDAGKAVRLLESDNHVLTGGSSNHYKLRIAHPKTFEPYNAECEDIIIALDMTFAEGEAFKAVWRSAAARLGNGKPGASALYDAQKVQHFGESMVLTAKHDPKSKIDII